MRNRATRLARRACGLALLVLAAGACGGRANQMGAGPPQPIRLGSEDVEALATLLRLEDRREFDSTTLRSLSAAEHPEVRRRAALAIGRLRDSAGVPLLLPLLADADTAVAATAAFALGQIADTAAVPALTSLLGGDIARRAPTVAGEISAALGKLPTAGSRAVLDSLLRATPVAPGADPLVIGPALLAVWKFSRGEDLTPIARWARAADPELRWRAVYALVRRSDPAATQTLAGMATDPDSRVRALAVRGLTRPLADSANLPAAAVVPVLVAAVGDSAYPVRISAARSLGTFPDPRSVQALTGLLASPEPHLAWTAAESLGRLGPEARIAASAIRTIAADTSRSAAIRAAALHSLVRIAPGEAEPLIVGFAGDPEWRLRSAAAGAYAELGPPTRPELAALVRDADARVSAAALAAALATAGDSLRPLRSMLVESLGAADVMVRAAALTGIEKLADPTVLPLVLDAYERALADTLNDAALAAVGTLGALRNAGAPAAHTLFRRFPRPADPLVRQRASELFGDAAQAWGAPLPIETHLAPAEYRAIVERWVIPALAGTPPRARIETEAGTLELELFAADAPLTVLNFVRLAEKGYFDGQRWPRVVPNFVIQGGDPRGDMAGGPGWAIRDELNRHRYVAGTLGMALSGPDTGGSQFFITHFPQPHLDGGYTVFGRVMDSLSVAERVLPGQQILRVSVLPPEAAPGARPTATVSVGR